MNPTVLIVDGHSANARLLQVLLGLDAIDGLIAHDASQALELAASRPVDAVALELRLPDMHGSELLRRLRAHAGSRSLPLVVFHAVDSEEELERAHAAGADALIEKPYRGMQVRVRLAALLGIPAARQQPATSVRVGPRGLVKPRGHSAASR